ncbi:MAG: hypothetical protein O9282_13825 [Flavobacterium sp.]|jgi:hypothetical protein|uniref:hypothetical protein n=1 Tax=Flavobacterium sp. TaxID=239 RepID=UPI0022C0CB0E|nr:hypothetical protein [Flavobacterium sp.]MCZ8023630.1 hypothetical protein [Cytophagales bacterium]MCZ8332383.1 hypothetical protein [Flavobacterium sp.]
MKTKHALFILLIGIMFDFIGAFLKILHYPGADEILIIAIVLKIGGGILILFKLFTHPKIKEFLNQ